MVIVHPPGRSSSVWYAAHQVSGLPPHAGQQPFVNFADQAHRHRQSLQPLQPVIHGTDVVEYLIDIA